MLGVTTPILSLLPRSSSDAATREAIETPNQKTQHQHQAHNESHGRVTQIAHLAVSHRVTP